MTTTSLKAIINPFSPDARRERARAEVDAAIARQQAAANDGVVLLNAAQLTPKPVRWLWPGWLAMGKLHILAGSPGEGKTTIAMSFAATVSTGGQWPDGKWCDDPGNVLIWSGEDDAQDTLLPRLIAAGAERSRCYIVGGTRVDGDVRAFDPARDMAALLAQAQTIGDVRLLVVDPLVSAVAGDSHKNTEVRRALQPMVDLGQRLGAAVLGISHLSKAGSSDGNPLNRVTGSIAFGALARLVLLTGRPRNGSAAPPGTRLVTRAKSNIGPDGGAFEYQVEQLAPLPGIVTNRVVWGQYQAGTARELLADAAGEGNKAEGDGGQHSQTALDEAEEFLRDALANGPTPTNTVKAEASDAGLAWVTVRRAAETLGVIKQRSSAGTWHWKLAQLPNSQLAHGT